MSKRVLKTVLIVAAMLVIVIFSVFIMKNFGNKATLKEAPIITNENQWVNGSTCLAMILAYHQKNVSVDEIIKVSNAAEDKEYSLLDMKNVASTYGLKLSGFSVEDVNALFKDEKNFPCVAHWEDNSFVVLNGIDKNKKVSINHPVSGRIMYSMSEFLAHFSGVIATFEVV